MSQFRSIQVHNRCRRLNGMDGDAAQGALLAEITWRTFPFAAQDRSPMSPDTHSVTRWIERLKHDDPRAAAVLWERFVERMLAVARQRLGNASRRVADKEDVVLAAFERLHHGVRQGRFPRLNDRDDLWAILFTLTVRHAARQARDLHRDKRGGGEVRGDSALEAAEPVDDAPTPEEALFLRERMATLLDALEDDGLRQIALARMEGSSNAEIATLIGRAEVTVERRLRLIRDLWQQHEEEDSGAG
jgi:RNA polymerase sigma factor (sigma-70 family)